MSPNFLSLLVYLRGQDVTVAIFLLLPVNATCRSTIFPVSTRDPSLIGWLAGRVRTQLIRIGMSLVSDELIDTLSLAGTSFSYGHFKVN